MVHEDYVTDLERTGDKLATAAQHFLDHPRRDDYADALLEAIEKHDWVRSEARGYGRF